MSVTLTQRVDLRMNPVLDEILRTQHVRAEDGSLVPLQSAVSAGEGRFLQGLILDLKPATSLEIGLAFGVSTLFICDALKEVDAQRHIVMDPDQHQPWWGSIGLLNLKRAGHEPLVEFHNLPSHRALPQLEAQGVKVDFAFIDGWHTFDHVLVDCFYVDKLLRVGGLMVLDDIDYPSLHKLCRFLLTNRSYRVSRCLEPQQAIRPSLKRRLAGRIAPRLPFARQLLKPEWMVSSEALGIIPESRCIALTKEAEDTRLWDAHVEF